MHLKMAWLYFACLWLAGCVFGYCGPAPADSKGDFVVNSEGASLEPCDLGPGLWDGNKPGTCIHVGPRTCDGCVVLPAGTPIRVMRVYVGAGGSQDVSIKVGVGKHRKVVHAFRNWPYVKRILVRP